MESNNKVSIITVCYNDKENLIKTIKSVLSQTYTNIEYIVVDGGSTDGTKEVLAQYEKDVSKCVSEKDMGIYDAMNKGIRMATGDWLNFMNAGDVFASNDVIEKIVSSGLMDECSFIYSDFYVERKDKIRLIKQDYGKGKVLHQSCVYKRSLHDKFGPYLVTKPYIVSDYWFFVQVGGENVRKFNAPISINDTAGISMQGTWCQFQKLCVDYMFRKISIFGLLMLIVEGLIKDFIKFLLRW